MQGGEERGGAQHKYRAQHQRRTPNAVPSILCESPTPEAVSNAIADWKRNWASSRPCYTKRYRVGGRVTTKYVRVSEAAQLIAKIEMLERLSKHVARLQVDETLRALMSLHAANETHFIAIENELVLALNAAGFHRPFRGPWRKCRVKPAGLLPTADCLLPNFEIRLIERVSACRQHGEQVVEIAGSVAQNACTYEHKKLIHRCAADARKRLIASQTSLDLLRKLAARVK